MSCYFRYLRGLCAEAGVTVTPANKRALDRALHAAVGVPYKRCMGGDGCWPKIKASLDDRAKRQRLIRALKQGQKGDVSLRDTSHGRTVPK